jgi:hypothetical protein
MQRNIVLFFLAIFAFSSFRVIYANQAGETCGPINFYVHPRENFEPDSMLLHSILFLNVKTRKYKFFDRKKFGKTFGNKKPQKHRIALLELGN